MQVTRPPREQYDDTIRAGKASPYMAGRLAWHAGDDATPPGNYSREQCDEWRRGYKDARTWFLRRAGGRDVRTR